MAEAGGRPELDLALGVGGQGGELAQGEPLGSRPLDLWALGATVG